MSPPIRLLVVDDSAFVRKVVREVVGGDPDVEVVGHARDGLDALEKIQLLEPDVVTLDLVMPDLDGLGVLRALADHPRPPAVLVVSTSAADSDLAVEALQLGAIDLVHKPTALATERMYDMSQELLVKLRVAAEVARRRPPIAVPRVVDPVPTPPSGGSADLPVSSATRRAAPPVEVNLRSAIVVVGTSSGGPQALTRLLADLPGSFPVPLAAVVHIPVGYTEALAERLDRHSALHVVEASDGLVFEAGTAVIARAGVHLRLERVGARAARCVLDPAPASLHRPSVDQLFLSTAAAFGEETLGVVLTGMGDDGREGARAIHAAGGRVVTEHPDTAIVDGMPRAVREAGLSDGVARLEALAAALGAWIVAPGSPRSSP